jgi:hypothetical protein
MNREQRHLSLLAAEKRNDRWAAEATGRASATFHAL